VSPISHVLALLALALIAAALAADHNGRLK